VEMTEKYGLRGWILQPILSTTTLHVYACISVLSADCDRVVHDDDSYRFVRRTWTVTNDALSSMTFPSVRPFVRFFVRRRQTRARCNMTWRCGDLNKCSLGCSSRETIIRFPCC